MVFRQRPEITALKAYHFSVSMNQTSAFFFFFCKTAHIQTEKTPEVTDLRGSVWGGGVVHREDWREEKERGG